MKITTVGIDLAKNVFQVHGVDERGRAVLKKQLKRHQVVVFFSNMPPCLIGMEACGGAHFWARRLQAQGHAVRLMAPQFVKPYVKGNKHDAADAEAICEAVSCPSMRFVPIKNIEQQSVLTLHRARQGFVGERTARPIGSAVCWPSSDCLSRTGSTTLTPRLWKQHFAAHPMRSDLHDFPG